MIKKYNIFSLFQHQSIFFFLLLIAVILPYYKTAVSLGYSWLNSFSYDHGLLVAPISIYFMWKKWPSLISYRGRVSVVGIIMLLLANILWFVAFLADIQSVAQMSLILILAALIMACSGMSGLLLMRFPLLYLSIAIPIWDPLQLILQNITVSVVGYWLNMVDIPSYVRGSYIQIPEGEFLVETTCAGLRYFLSATAIFSLYSYLYFKNYKTATILLAVSLTLAVMLNWVRVFIVIVAGHLTNMQHFLVHQHATFGWWLFALIIIPIFFFGNYLQKRESEATI